MKDPVVILSRDGRVREANTAFSELTALKRDDMIGRDCRDIIPLDQLWNGITACIFYGSTQSEQISFGDRSFEVSLNPVLSGESLSHVCIVLRDITSFVNLERECIRRNRELMVTNTLSSAFISSEDIGSLYGDLVEKVLLVSDFAVGWIATMHDGAFTLQASTGLSLEFRNKLEAGRLDFIYGDALKSGEPLHVLEPDEASAIEDLKREGIVFFAAVPLRAGSDVLGLLALASRVEVKFDFDFVSLLSLVGNNLSLIAEKIRLFQEAERLARTDSLTGLYNARHFYSVLNSEVARTSRYGTPFSLVLFDIDDFKTLNDTYGHQAGDEVLHAVAETFAKESRKTDTVARYGGEEFIIVLPSTPKEEAYRLALRLKDAVERDAYLGDLAVRVTLSGGVATSPDDALDAKSLLYAADMAMYDAKSAGKKKVVCHGEPGEGR